MTKNKDKLIVKLEELMLRLYLVSTDEITNERWEVVKEKWNEN
ncbi:hypothetical protein [Spiroplasma sp. ChiS]|nr:hypothetical protein [Spiroplasma sp. ChiS]